MPHENPSPDDREELPRQTLWSTIPKRTLSRVFLLLGLLAGILYLRQSTGAIAGCMAQAFQAPQPSAPGVRLKGARVVPSTSPGEAP